MLNRRNRYKQRANELLKIQLIKGRIHEGDEGHVMMFCVLPGEKTLVEARAEYEKSNVVRCYPVGEFRLAIHDPALKRNEEIALLIQLLEASIPLQDAIDQIVDSAFRIGVEYGKGKLKLKRKVVSK
jgi:hypothetical protein